MTGNLSSTTSLGLTFPDIQVPPKQHIEPGTGSTVAFAWILLIIFGAFLTLLSSGIILVILLISALAEWAFAKRAMAQIRGSGLEVSPQQFPEIHACAETFARRLGMDHTPSIFIVESASLNAAAMRVGSRKVIVLIDDIVDACLRSGDNRTLGFILAHEMAHHALNHTGWARAHLRQMIKKLSRLDEFTCDAVANALVADCNISSRALATLAVGPQLLPHVNMDALHQQAREVQQDKLTKKAERPLTHPLILNRIARFCS